MRGREWEGVSLTVLVIDVFLALEGISSCSDRETCFISFLQMGQLV